MEMHNTILSKLDDIEQKQGLRLIYVAESGNRAWGFPSSDSDYDVRAIFVHRTDVYLAINNPRETFEWIENQLFDVGGWDLRKALRLLRKSNSTLLEWLQSPTVYRAYPGLQQELLILAKEFYQPDAGLYHYRGIAKTTYALMAQDTLKLKKWFYLLRALLAAHWIVSESTLPPMDLKTLQSPLSEATQQEINDLIAFKKDKDETFLWTPTPSLRKLIEQLWETTSVRLPSRQIPDSEKLNQWFREFIYGLDGE